MLRLPAEPREAHFEPATPSVWHSRPWMLAGIVALVLIAIGGLFASRRLRRPR